MYCKHCGKEIADDSKFCNYCGANQKAVSNNIKPRKKIDKNRINPNRSLGPISSGDVKVFSCSPESKKCLPLIHGSHKT